MVSVYLFYSFKWAIFSHFFVLLVIFCWKLDICMSPSLCRLALFWGRLSLIIRTCSEPWDQSRWSLKVFSILFRSFVFPGPVCVLFTIPSYAQLLLNVLISLWIGPLFSLRTFCSVFLSIILCPRHLWVWSLSAAIKSCAYCFLQLFLVWSNLCLFWLSEIQIRRYRHHSLRTPPERLELCKLHTLCSVVQGWELRTRLPLTPNCTTPGQGGVEQVWVKTPWNFLLFWMWVFLDCAFAWLL